MAKLVQNATQQSFSSCSQYPAGSFWVSGVFQNQVARDAVSQESSAMSPSSLLLCLWFQVPLRMMESVESRDMFQLHIVCKDSKVVR